MTPRTSLLQMKMLDPRSKWEELERKRRRVRLVVARVPERVLLPIAVSANLKHKHLMKMTVEMRALRSRTLNSCDKRFRSSVGALILWASQLTSSPTMSIA